MRDGPDQSHAARQQHRHRARRSNTRRPEAIRIVLNSIQSPDKSEVLLFDDYVSCKEEIIDGQTFAGQNIFNEDTGKDFKLQSPVGQRVFREALRESAFHSWTSIGLYSQHVVNENSKI